jgi:hypothetical protein
MISYIHCGWHLVSKGQPVFALGANPKIPVNFPQSQEMNLLEVTSMVDCISRRKYDAFSTGIGALQILSAKEIGTNSEAVNLELFNQYQGSMRIPEICLLGLASAALHALRDWYSCINNANPASIAQLAKLQQQIDLFGRHLEVQGSVSFREQEYQNVAGLKVRGVVAIIQYAEAWLPEMDQEQLHLHMWVSIENVIHGGNRIQRITDGLAYEETDRTMVADYLKVEGIWGTKIPESFYEIDYDDTTSNLDVYLAHYHQLLEFRAQFQGETQGIELLDRVAIDWFYNVKRKLPIEIDLFAFTEACFKSIADVPISAMQKIELDLLGWRIRLYLDWVTLGNVGLVNADFVYDLREDEEEDELD